MFTFFKNPFGDQFNKKTLSPDQIKEIERQINSYYGELAECHIKIAWPKNPDEELTYITKKIMIRHRILKLKLKLLKNCNCGADHSQIIAEIEERSRHYLNILISESTSNE